MLFDTFHCIFPGKAHYRAKKWTSKYHWNAWVSQVSLWYCTAAIKHNNSFEMMVGLFGNWVESLLFQLSYDGLYSGPGPPPDLGALTFTSSKTLRCIVSRWWLVWLRALFLRLHFSLFSSSPSALIIPPTRKCCSGGLSVEPSQKHKSSFIAFYRLLHHRKCRVECTEMVTESLFLFSYSLFANNNFVRYHHQLAGVCNDKCSSLSDLSSAKMF